jgi:hypothetical protein
VFEEVLGARLRTRWGRVWGVLEDTFEGAFGARLGCA